MWTWHEEHKKKWSQWQDKFIYPMNFTTKFPNIVNKSTKIPKIVEEKFSYLQKDNFLAVPKVF